MKSFLNQLIIALLVLFSLAGLASTRWESFNLFFGVIGIAMMALNAFLAIYPLHRFPKADSLQVYLGGMLARLLALGVLLAVLLSSFNLQQSEKLSLVLCAFAAFVTFQFVEIRFFQKLKDSGNPT